MVFTVTFAYDDQGKSYTTQPMGVRDTIAFLVESHNQGMVLAEVREIQSVAI